MKTFRILPAAVIVLAAVIGFSVPRGFSQPPAPSYEQTVSLNGGQLGYDQINVTGPFSLTAPDSNSTARTDAETLSAISATGMQTLNGSALSQVSVTPLATSFPDTASTFANYFTEVDSSTEPTVLIDIVGTVSGSVGTANGAASATVALNDNAVTQFGIGTGAPDVNTSLDQEIEIPTNVPNLLELATSASVTSGSGTVVAEIDPYVQIDPSVPNPDLYTLKFFTTPIPEPNLGVMIVGGLGLLVTFQRFRSRSA